MRNGFHQILNPLEGVEPVQAHNNWARRVETIARTDVSSALLTQCVEVYARRRITIDGDVVGNGSDFRGWGTQTHRQRTDLRRIGAQHSSLAEDERQDHTNRKKAPIPVIELRHAHNIGAGQCDRKRRAATTRCQRCDESERECRFDMHQVVLSCCNEPSEMHQRPR
jgi:hypothetical protein